MKTRIAISVALLAALGFTLPVEAQGTSRRIPVLVATAPALQGTGTTHRLSRFAGEAPRDVILLAPGATAADLSAAVEELILIRRNVGDVPSRAGAVRMQPGGEAARAPVLPWAARVLSDLASAPMRQVPGVGRVRSVQIWLPAQASKS